MTPQLIAIAIDLLKRAGIIRDPEQEAKAAAALREASAQFLISTSSPIYGVARVIVVYASLWDIFLNGGRAWAQTGLAPILELVPVLWLFLGPEIVQPVVNALGQAFKNGGRRAVEPTTSGASPPGPTSSAPAAAPFTSGSGFRGPQP